MKQLLILLFTATMFLGCNKDYDAPVPDFSNWQAFNDAPDMALNKSVRTAMEGVYALEGGEDQFGELVALKWSFVNKGTDTTFHVSGFFGKDIAYFICEGRRSGNGILLNGYWRKMVSTATGIMRLEISDTNGAALLCSANPVITPGSVRVEGLYGNGSEEPTSGISFAYDRLLNRGNPGGFQILAHRSGGRTSDLLPVSENSLEMILKTAEFGSTGIEIDIRYTSDSIPVLYHDNTLNLRLIQKSGLVGDMENYSLAQLSAFVRLVNGEKIPTLRQALDVVVYQTDLSLVWLDTKYDRYPGLVRAIQKEYLAKAAAAGRKVEILIGLPGEEQLEEFLKLPDYANTPSLCELSVEDAVRCNAKVWAPRFTEGTSKETLDEVHAMGKKVFIWTVDVPDFISQYISEGNFDGILSNYPSCVAYHYYVRQ